MNSRNAGLRSVLSRLIRPNCRARCRSGIASRRADIGGLVLAELRGRRQRLAELLRLLDEELRRDGDAAFPSGSHAKSVPPFGRSRLAA